MECWNSGKRKEGWNNGTLGRRRKRRNDGMFPLFRFFPNIPVFQYSIIPALLRKR